MSGKKFLKFPHCAHITVWKLREILSRIFDKNFLEVTVLLYKLLKSYILWRNIFLLRDNFSFFQTVHMVLFALTYSVEI